MRDRAFIHSDRSSRRFDITVVGDTNLDMLLYGLPENLPTERELLADGMAIQVGGSGAITAHNLAALGNTVGFITPAADDDFGKLCRAELCRSGVDLSCAVSAARAQTGVTVLLQHQRLRHMFTYPGATSHLNFDDLDLDYLSDARHFHMSSFYLQRTLTSRIPELFANLKRAGLTLSLDPNDDPEQKWDRGIFDAIRQVDVFMPNEREACLLVGETDLDRAIATLREMVPVLVIKRGEKGASVFCGDECWSVPSRAVQLVDAIGAGDSFNAGFLHGWTRGWSIERALAYGNLTAAWSATASGGTAAFRDVASLSALEAAWQAELLSTSK